MQIALGRAVVAARAFYGIAAIIFGFSLLLSRQFNVWETGGGITAPVLLDVLLYVTAVAQIAGGLALQRHETARIGAGLVLGVYVLFALLHVPGIAAHPLVYAYWGGFFEQLALVAGALILFQQPGAAAGGLVLFRLCAVSFMLYQAFYIPQTAALVPKWIPLGQTFWAIATTVAFGLAALALIIRRMDVLAVRLMALMLVIFQLAIWIPALVATPTSHTVWAANAENLGIAACAWIVASCLARAVAMPTLRTSPAVL